MRVLHIADIHLDRPFVGFSQAEARERRRDVWNTFKKCLDLAVERDVDLITVGGDLWEDENVITDTRVSVARALGQSGRDVMLVTGNHDRLLPGGNYQRTEWPANVRLFESTEPLEQCVGHVSIWGASWTADDLTAGFLDRFTAPDDGRVHLLLMHGTAGGIPDAYCRFDPAQAQRAGFAAVLCGHLHRASWDSGVLYPGSPEPLRWQETGEHCAAIVEVTEAGEIEVELVPVNRRVYVDREVDCAGAASSVELGEKVAASVAVLEQDSRDVCLKLTLVGEVDLQVEIDRQSLEREFAEQFDLVRIVDETTRAMDLDELATHETADGIFVSILRQQFDEEPEGRERQVIELALQAGLRAMRGDGSVLDVS